MIKIKASVIANQKMTYVQDNNACMQIDCSAGINDLLLPDCCRKLGLADYPKDNALIEELACYWKRWRIQRWICFFLETVLSSYCIL